MSELVPGLVHVAGNAVLDVLVRDVEPGGEAADSWGANVQLLERPVEGTLGGCGAATSYLLGRLGQRVQLNSNLGDDSWGALVRGWLEEAGVDICGTLAAVTAVHVIALDRKGQRRSLYFTGEKVQWKHSLDGDTPEWFLASGYGRVDAEDLVEMREVFAKLRQRGAKVMFDPSPWFEGRVSAEEMHGLFREVDCLVGTEGELRVWQEAQDSQELAVRILEMGPEIAVVKRGAEGAVFAESSGERGCLSAEKVENANSVGAGDTFNGRLLCGLCQREDLRSAVGEAVRIASRVVGKGRGVLGAFE